MHSLRPLRQRISYRLWYPSLASLWVLNILNIYVILLITSTFVYQTFFCFTGSCLVKVGQTEQKLGQAEREFIQTTANNFLQPLKAFLDGDMKTLQARVTVTYRSCTCMGWGRVYRHQTIIYLLK